MGVIPDVREEVVGLVPEVVEDEEVVEETDTAEDNATVSDEEDIADESADEADEEKEVGADVLSPGFSGWFRFFGRLTR